MYEDCTERCEVEKRRLWRDAYTAAPYESLKNRLQLGVRSGTANECSTAAPCICISCEAEQRELTDIFLYVVALRTRAERQRSAQESCEAKQRQLSDDCLYAVSSGTNKALIMIT